MIYIVEDDDAIRELEQYALQSNGYEVASFASSEPFWQAMRTEAPELVILDVMLPGEDGFSILKKLRNTPSLHRLPIIMVTAKSSELDTVRGLDCGADDYISKPFGIMEFLSRVRASLRRAAPEERPNVLSFHEILLDNARHSVTVNNQPVELTYKEYSLLRLLLENTNLVVTRETILQVVWGTDISVESRTVDMRLFLMGFLGLLFTAALCIFVFHRAFTAQAWDDLEKESDLIRAGYDLTSEPQQLSFFVTGDLRITLISPDGDVIFESATDQPMENHLTRPEIVQALQGSIGKDIRDSQTMGYETYYYAVQLPGGNILRVAQDAETVWSVYDGALPAIVLSCVALMLAAAILSTLLTRALVQPVLNMTEDLDHIQDKVPYKELIPFAESIHADRILRENNEKMRQEFTANVSHELKTPLTSISGYAELIETGIAKPEDVPGFAQKIHGEASRMIQLVNDILQLSSLDNASETSSMPEMEVVDLLDVVKECVERQKLNARHAYITLTYLGESAPVRGNRNLLDELCQNLCDNAIRYNRPGGKVQIVTACTRDGHCSLTVTDNGIGIPRESQSSVFERFYRVDKSRSKATGGTGLGLAIVKHIALIHEARIKLESQVDVGTTITVTFPTAS